MTLCCGFGYAGSFFFLFFVLSGNVAEDVALSRPSALGSEVTCPSPPWPIIFFTEGDGGVSEVVLRQC